MTEDLTWMNHWTKELWACRTKPILTLDITKYARSLVNLGYEAVSDELLAELLIELQGKLPAQPFFVRLNTRSPKDFTEGKPTLTPADIIDVLAHSMRTTDDMIGAIRNNQPVFLYVFAFDFSMANEFRVFVKNNEILAITQYELTATTYHPATVKGQARAVFDKINPHIKLDDYVFDYYVTAEEPEFLEINPYGKSDPILFKNYFVVEQGGIALQVTRIYPSEEQ